MTMDILHLRRSESILADCGEIATVTNRWVLIEMPKLTVLEELDIAIKLAAKDAEPGVTSRIVAAEFYTDNMEMVAPFIREWVISKLASLIGKHRARTKRQANPQLTFESMLGFKNMPAKIELESGESVPRADATIRPWRKFARSLTKQPNRARVQALRVVELMAPYAATEKGITWGEVAKREAEKIPRALSIAPLPES